MDQAGVSQDSGALGVVARMWRYPVKSMGGERVEAAWVDERGLIGDRLYAVWDAEGKLGSGKNSNRFRRMDGLLDLRTRYAEEPEPGTVPIPELVSPDGSRFQVGTPGADAAVRAHLGRQDVAVRREAEISHFDSAPIHLVSEATLDWLLDALAGVPSDERRLRPNLVLRVPGGAAFAEDAWVGRVLRVGQTLVEVSKQTARCVMTNAAQGDLPYSSLPLKSVAGREMNLGVYARVLRGGRIRVGDEVRPAA